MPLQCRRAASGLARSAADREGRERDLLSSSRARGEGKKGEKSPPFQEEENHLVETRSPRVDGVTTTSNERGIPRRHARKRREKEKKHHDHDAPTFGSREISLSFSLSRSFYLHVNRVIVQVRERMRNKRKEKFALDCYIIVPFTRFPGSFFLKEEQH